MAFHDVLIKGALVYDGTLNPPRYLNVAIKGDRISLVSDSGNISAHKTIEAHGKILAPGFIDIHTHTDLEVMRDRSARPMLNQGITTSIGGNCGIGLYPYSKGLREGVRDILGPYDGNMEFASFGEYLEALNENGLGNNEAYFTAHMPLRLKAMNGLYPREATDAEIDTMCSILDEALSSGSVGFSTGLYYAPCVFASRKELLSLLGVVKRHDRLFAVHHRSEGDDVIPSLREVLDLARESGVRLEISHLKAIGNENQGKVPLILEMIESYRNDGVDVRFDQYPYTYGSTSLFSLLPPRLLGLSRIEMRLSLSLESERERVRDEIMHPDGWDSVYKMVGPDDIWISYLENRSDYDGLSLTELGERLGKDPLESLFDVLSDEVGEAVMLDRTESDVSLVAIMRHPLMCFGSDSLYSSERPHPRSYFATIEFLSKYVRDKRILTLEEAVSRLTGEPSRRVGLKDRGFIREGYMADMVLFDLDELSYDPGLWASKGIYAVFVNGVEAISDGAFTDSLSGRALSI